MSENNVHSFTINETLKAKGIAILLLTFHHMFISSSNLENINLRLISYADLMACATNARFCVWIFVFLSAYGMSIQYERTMAYNYRKFIGHRLLKLAKLYWPFLTIEYVILLFTRPATETITNPIYLIANILGVADMVGQPKISRVYWYISFTIVLIIFFPMLYSLCKKYGLITWVLFCIISLGFMGGGIRSSQGGVYTQYFSAVLTGIIFAQRNVWINLSALIHQEGLPVRTVKCLIFFMLLAAILFFPVLRNSSLPDLMQYKQLLMTGAAVATCWLSYDILTGRNIEAFLGFLGKHSGNIFLIHTTVLQYMKNILYWSRNGVISYIFCFLICLVISIAVNALLHFLEYDELFNRLDNRLFRVYER